MNLNWTAVIYTRLPLFTLSSCTTTLPSNHQLQPLTPHTITLALSETEENAAMEEQQHKKKKKRKKGGEGSEAAKQVDIEPSEEASKAALAVKQKGTKRKKKQKAKQAAEDSQTTEVAAEAPPTAKAWRKALKKILTQAPNKTLAAKVCPAVALKGKGIRKRETKRVAGRAERNPKT